jgi:hypothetical protein
MKKSRLGVVAGIALAAAVIGGVTAVATISSPAPEEVVIHSMSAEYPAFDSAAALADSSALVVRATAVEIGKAYHDVPAGLDVSKLPAHKAAQVGTMQHDVVFRVEGVLRGDVTVGTNLAVVQLGGQLGVDRYVADAEPMSVKDSEYLLFLVPLQNDRFGIVGGPQGRYLVEKGTLKVLDAETAARGVANELNGTAVTAVGNRLGS